MYTIACLCAQSRVTFCDPMDCNAPGSCVHRISQTRILEWVAISSFRGSSQPGIKPTSPALAGRFFATEPSRTQPCSVLWAYPRQRLRDQSWALPYYVEYLQDFLHPAIAHVICHVNSHLSCM